jgi:hypothetical protein
MSDGILFFQATVGELRIVLVELESFWSKFIFSFSFIDSLIKQGTIIFKSFDFNLKIIPYFLL